MVHGSWPARADEYSAGEACSSHRGALWKARVLAFAVRGVYVALPSADLCYTEQR